MSMLRQKLLCILCVAVCAFSPPRSLVAQAAGNNGFSVRVVYVGNAGVLLSSGNSTVLIDAFNLRGNPYYQRVPEAVVQKMADAQPPFDDLQAVLVTHLHRDHFDAGAVHSLLESHPFTVFLAPLQVCENLAENVPPEFYRKRKYQILAKWPGFQDTSRVKIGDLQITLLGLHHGSKKFSDVENAGYLLDFQGIKILHIGDAEATSVNFKPFHLAEQKIDLAFIPYWYLIYTRHNRELVRKYIRPKQIVVIHIPPQDKEKVLQKLREYFPEAKPLTEPMQEISFYF